MKDKLENDNQHSSDIESIVVLVLVAMGFLALIFLGIIMKLHNYI